MAAILRRVALIALSAVLTSPAPRASDAFVPQVQHRGGALWPSDPYGCGLLPFRIAWGLRTLDVTAVLLDGRTLSGRSRICRDTPEDAMMVRINGESIGPEATRFLVAAGDTGLPNFSDWLFPALRGRLDAFTVQPRQAKRKIAYIEQDGILDPYRDATLSRMVRDHAEASAYMRRKAWGRYGSWGMGAAGGALFLTAALLPGVDEKEASGAVTRTTYLANALCVAAGIGFVLTGSGWYLVTRNNHVQAIQAYNAGAPRPFRAD